MNEIIIKALTESSISVGCLIALLYYISYDKKQTNKFIEEFNETNKEMVKSLNANTQTLEKMNLRIENLEKRFYNKEE